MKAVITGAGGMLGWDLGLAFPRARRLLRADLDVTNENAVRNYFLAERPGLVLNSAAYTNVDGAETEREQAHLLNAEAPARLARWCGEIGAKLVHFGTDQVFDGKSTSPRTEDEAPSPTNHYAETKLLGERAVLQSPGALVLRVQWLYGKKKDRFSPLKQKDVFTPFRDQIGAPTWTKPLASTVSRLVERGSAGLFHFSYDDYASWAQVFEFVKEQWNLPLRLEPKATSDVKLPAGRPLFSVLSNRKLCRELEISGMGSWKDPLKAFLHEV